MMKIGFIGQGWIGKNYADSFEDRGFSVTRYSLEEPFIKNKKEIPFSDIVFIAVPTPTTPKGFDESNVLEALDLVGAGKIAVIKSTIPPGTTKRFQAMYPDKFIFHIPEFLREAYARYDVDNPDRLVVGVPIDTPEYMEKATMLIEMHPNANYTKITSSHEAEFIKYAHNTLGYATVVFMNILYDLAEANDVEWSVIKEGILNNPWYPSKYLDPVHHGGRGAGGDCFIKDFATLAHVYKDTYPEDAEGNALLQAFIKKNNKMLRDTGKDLDLLEGVYGKEV